MGQHKRKEDSEKHTADQTRRRELARRGKWKEMQVKLQDEELQTSFDMASDYIQTLEHECHVKTPRYLTDDTDPTISRLKDLLQVEGVFLRGKKHSRESLIFVLDQLLDKAKDLKKTKDLLEIIKENSGMGDPGGDNTAAQYHSGLGLGPAVPCFLRHRGKVKYSAIGKKE